MPVRVDVFEDDDRVVDEHTDAEQQTRHRDHVDRNLRKVHEKERDDDRHGDRKPDDDRTLNRTQKDKQHDDRKQRSLYDGLYDFRNRLLDDIRIVRRFDDIDVGRQFDFYSLDRLAYRMRRVDGIFAALFLDVQYNAGCSVQIGERVFVFVTFVHVGDIAEAYRCNARPRRLRSGRRFIRNDGIFQIFDARVFAARFYRVIDIAARNRTAGTLYVLRTYHLRDGSDRKPVRFEPVARYVDVDRFFTAADDPCRRDAVDLFEARLHDIICVSTEFFGRSVPLQRERHDRHERRIGSDRRRRRCTRRQIAPHQIDFIAYFGDRRIEIGVKIEFHKNQT